MFTTIISDIKQKFQRPLPGEEAQYLMAPQGRRSFPQSSKISTAAVLILLYPIDNELNVVFMKRPEYPGAHSGQVCLPGGKVEEKDKSLYHTALRETSEELGFDTSNLEYLGQLSPLHIPVSGFDVHPFVAFCPFCPQWKPDPEEVTYLLEIPLNLLQHPNTIKIEKWTIHKVEMDVPFYSFQNEKIWGATAMIISEFLEALKA